jgi:serine/threonine protein kinase
MDFVDGRSLREVLEDDGPLAPDEAAAVARQIALALDHAHAAKILHRDVKPGNVILRADGTAVLVDFGNAEALGEAADRKGTAHYVAPEVFQGKRQDEKTDTYSLGATLFHLLAGEPPFQGQSVKEILAAHEAGKVRAPSHVNPDAGIPREMDVLVKRSMASARGYRLGAMEFAEALDGLKDVFAETAAPARPRRPRGGAAAGARSSGPPAAVILAILAGVAVVGIAVAASLGRKDPPPVAPPPPVTGPKTVDPLTAPGGDAPGGPVGPGIENRAEARAARDAAAAKALAGAEEFAGRNPDRPKEVAARFAAVASEFAELAQGRKAKEEAAAWGQRALSGGERDSLEAARKAEEAKEAKAREEGLAKVAAAVLEMRFGDAVNALDDVEPPLRGRDAWKRRQERLNALLGFRELLDEALQSGPVSSSDLRVGIGKIGEKAVAASAEGVLMRGSSGERTVPWKELRPADVVALARKCLRNAPEPRLALASWCFEAGIPAEGRKEVDVALLTDRTGTVPARVAELFDPE